MHNSFIVYEYNSLKMVTIVFKVALATQPLKNYHLVKFMMLIMFLFLYSIYIHNQNSSSLNFADHSRTLSVLGILYPIHQF